MSLDVGLVVRCLGCGTLGCGTLSGRALGEWAVCLDLVLWADLVRHPCSSCSGAHRADSVQLDRACVVEIFPRSLSFGNPR